MRSAGQGSRAHVLNEALSAGYRCGNQSFTFSLHLMKTHFYLLFLLLIGGLSLPTYAQKARYIGSITEVATLYQSQARAVASRAANPP